MENSILGGLIRQLDNLVWGPALLLLLLGSGSYLMLRLRFLPLRNLKFALKCAFGGDSPPGKNTLGKGSGRASSGSVSSLASLTTELATTLGIGNIIGVAMAMVLGGPGALFWMVATSIVGMATKLVESMLSVKYRGKNQKGQSAGGPMYTCLHAFPGKPGRILGTLFALLAVTASFGMGNMTQSNSIADTLWVSFRVPKADTGLFLTILTVLVVIGGISVIGKVTQVLVPFMGVFYLLGALAVILVHWRNLPGAVAGILTAAFHPQAVSGGIFGTVTVSAYQSLRWGVARGIFSNEAGIGAPGITAGRRHGGLCETGIYQYDRGIPGHGGGVYHYRAGFRGLGSFKPDGCQWCASHRDCPDPGGFQHSSGGLGEQLCKRLHCALCLCHRHRLGLPGRAGF